MNELKELTPLLLIFI